MRGSITVEASLIMPFCLAVIGVFSWLGVFQYNRAVMKLTACEYIVRFAEQRMQERDEFVRELTGKLEQAAEERTLALREIRASVKVTGSTVVAELNAEQRIIWSGTLNAKASYKITHPETALRIAGAAGMGERNERDVKEGFE